MTGWKIDYILDSTTLLQLIMIHSYGMEFEETKAIILLNKVLEIITGKKSKTKEEISDKPDIAKFKKIYGNKIKTPNKKE